MRDQPRFEPLPPIERRSPGGAGRLWLADLLARGRSWRPPECRRAGRPDKETSGVRLARLRALLTALGLSALVLVSALGGAGSGARLGSGQALPPQPSKACPA